MAHTGQPDAAPFSGVDRNERDEIDLLRAQLSEAQETLAAIAKGEVDALVIDGAEGVSIYTLEGAEHPYRRIVEEMGEGAASLLPDGTVLYSNQRLADLLRMPLQELIGSSFHTFVAPADTARFDSLLAPAATGGGQAAYLQLDLVVAGAKGEAATVPVYLSAGALDIGGRHNVCLVVTDLTEQRRNEEMIEANRRKLDEERQKANRLESIGILAGGLAHDLNNSLAAILGNIALAERAARGNEELVRKLMDAESACMQARDVTQQLLTFSRGGRPVVKPADLAPLLREWASFAMAGSNVACEFDLPPDLWLVDVDDGQISRVVNNLVINAQQAMPTGGTITIRGENLHLDTADLEAKALPLSPGAYVCISVQDKGTGIAPAHRPHIFDPYFTTKQKGSGLGLAIAYSVVKAHSGYITLESELGVGSTFYVYLPISKMEASEQVERRQSEASRPLRILVMDDQPAIRDMVAEILAGLEGHDVAPAADGEQAIALYREAMETGKPFDLVLMDLTIAGGMGGREAVRHLVEIDPEVRSIVFSGYSNDAIMSNFGEYGFRGVLRKPFSIEELVDEVRRVAND